MFMCRSAGTIYSEASTAYRVVDKVNVCATQIINGDFVNNDFDAVCFKSCVYIADVVVECHAEIYARATASTTSDIYT